MGVVIVTGGTFGLGQSITVELARRSHRVVAFGLARGQPSSITKGLDSDAAATSGTVVDVGCFAHQGGPVPAPPTA